MHILLPFHNKPTLDFACGIGIGLTRAGASITYAQIAENIEIESKAFSRHVSLYFPGGPDIYIELNELISDGLLSSFDAIVLNALPKNVSAALDIPAFKNRKNRSCFIALLQKLDFFPEKSIATRKNYDIVYLNNGDQLKFISPHSNISFIGIGNPSLTLQSQVLGSPDGHILVVEQTASPLTIAGRIHMVNLVCAIALAHPGRQVVVKLPYGLHDHKDGVYKEAFRYYDLLREIFTQLPANISFYDGLMVNALRGAAVCIGCTSSAIIDSIVSGVPAMVYLSYPEAIHDPLSDSMRRAFEASDLIVSESDVVNLNIRQCEQKWLNTNFQQEMPYAEMLQQIRKFQLS